MFRRGQIEEIQNKVLLLDNTPDSSRSLAFCKSMRTRRRQRLPTQLPLASLNKLKAWVSDPSSSMVLAQGQGVKTSSLDFAVDFLDAVLEREYPVVWALPNDFDSDRPAPSVVGILKSLVSQLLELNCGQRCGVPIVLNQFKAKTTIRQWFDVLERCISNCSRLFIVIDTTFVQSSLENEEGTDGHFILSDFMENVSDIIARRGQGGLKVVIISWRFDTIASMEAEGVFDERQFPTDMGRRVQRLIRQPKYRAIFRRGNRDFAKQFQFPVDDIG